MIAAIAEVYFFFLNDRSDHSDRSDHMETRLSLELRKYNSEIHYVLIGYFTVGERVRVLFTSCVK